MAHLLLSLQIVHTHAFILGLECLGSSAPHRPLFPTLRPPCISLQVSLGFLTAWWLGSKSTIVRLPDIFAAFYRTSEFRGQKRCKWGGKCLCLLVRGEAKDLWPSLVTRNSVPQSCHQTCYFEVKIKQMNPSPVLCISLANTAPGCTCVQVSSSFYVPCSEVHWTGLCKSQHRSLLVTIEVFTFLLLLLAWEADSNCFFRWMTIPVTSTGFSSSKHLQVGKPGSEKVHLLAQS